MKKLNQQLEEAKYIKAIILKQPKSCRYIKLLVECQIIIDKIEKILWKKY